MKSVISIIGLVIALINILLMIFAFIYSKKDNHKLEIISLIIKLVFVCSIAVVVLELIDLFL